MKVVFQRESPFRPIKDLWEFYLRARPEDMVWFENPRSWNVFCFSDHWREKWMSYNNNVIYRVGHHTPVPRWGFSPKDAAVDIVSRNMIANANMRDVRFLGYCSPLFRIKGGWSAVFLAENGKFRFTDAAAFDYLHQRWPDAQLQSDSEWLRLVKQWNNARIIVYPKAMEYVMAMARLVNVSRTFLRILKRSLPEHIRHEIAITNLGE